MITWTCQDTHFFSLNISSLSQVIQFKRNYKQTNKKKVIIFTNTYSNKMDNVKTQMQNSCWRLTINFLFRRCTRMKDIESMHKLLKLYNTISFFIENIKHLENFVIIKINSNTQFKKEKQQQTTDLSAKLVHECNHYIFFKWGKWREYA